MGSVLFVHPIESSSCDSILRGWIGISGGE